MDQRNEPMESIGSALNKLGLKLPTQSSLSSKTDTPLPPVEPTCKYCRDGHFLHPLKEDGRVDYAQVIPCRYCMSPDAVCRFLGVSSMESTFKNWKPVKGGEDAFKAAKRIAGLKTEWKLLLICGTWGNGKTHLLEAIALEIWKTGQHIQIQTFPDFVAKLKGTFDRQRDKDDTRVSFNDLMIRLCTMPYLLLDDVGSAGSFTPFSLEQLERIMLSRYRDDLFTVITTNLDKNALPEFIISRFSDAVKSRMVLNKAPDYREKVV